MTFLEALHFGAALSALGLGLVILAAAKGTRAHRWIGQGFAAAMLIVNGAALASYEDGRFGIFHWLALVSLVTLAMGLRSIRARRTADHAMWMCWTYAGLASAGSGQFAVLLSAPQPAIYAAIAATVAASYWALNIRRWPVTAATALRR